jgi:hypothetical protein
MINRRYIFLIIAGMILPACTPTAVDPSSIGSIERVSDTVQHNENQVTEVDNLFQNDSLRMFGGGEGLLDFGSDMRLRMFNDTELGGVRTTGDPETPMIVQLTLFSGGFSGQLFREGGKFEFDTPNGAKIHVFATTFVVAYDRTTQQTLVANFEGDVRVEAAGSQLIQIRPGEIYQVQAGKEPVFWGQVPWTPGEYEEQARSSQSALIPFGLPITGKTPTEPSISTPSPTTLVIDSPTPEPTSTSTLIPPTATKTQVPPTSTETQVPCPPLITVNQKAWCREGPSQGYIETDSFVAGEILQVEGRNNNESWWWVRRHTRGSCWISEVAVDIVGESSCLPIITPPPTYTPTPTKPPSSTPTLCPGLNLGTPCP